MKRSKVSWKCEACTYPNTPDNIDRCNMCGQKREESEIISITTRPLTALKLLWRDRKINQIEVEFSGSGDSGDIGGIFCYYREIKDNEYVNVDKDKIKNTKGIGISEGERGCIDGMASKILDECGMDWYNNEGGYGVITITYNRGKAWYDVSYEQRMESTEHDDFRGDIS